MARFRYLGEQLDSDRTASELRVGHGPERVSLFPSGGKEVFEKGEELPTEFSDPRSLRLLRLDPRFEEIV